MSEYWWWDTLAVIGLGCAVTTALVTVYMFVSEFRARRKFTREMREFDRQMGALVRAWEKSE